MKPDQLVEVVAAQVATTLFPVDQEPRAKVLPVVAHKPKAASEDLAAVAGLVLSE